ncbi:hypothetical protein [Candidatus Odyssella thessalonicensis]|uniref:hypothetical protein n=1 Tax=Candidatus Odyssella thessalonicensis TaxID=84647 RepID=UPI000225AECB|nr:hypothetical protein [Candidatus Odyssella thessalonicensis]
MKKYFFCFLWLSLHFAPAVEVLPAHSLSSVSRHPLYQHLMSQETLAPYQLNYAGTPLGSQKAIVLGSFIQGRKHLTSIDLSACNLEDQEAELILSSLSHHTQLQYLNLSINEISKRAASLLSQLIRHNGKLQYLDLHNNHFTDACLTLLLESLKGHPHIGYLELSFNTFHNSSLASLKGVVREGISLKRLAISGIGLTALNAVSLLAAVSHNTTITELSLSYNNLSSLGREIGKMMRMCPNLKKIELVCCNLSMADFKQIMDELKRDTLPSFNAPLFGWARSKERRVIHLALEDSLQNRNLKEFYKSAKADAVAIELNIRLGLA